MAVEITTRLALQGERMGWTAWRTGILSGSGSGSFTGSPERVYT